MKTPPSDLQNHYSLLLGLVPPWLVTNVSLDVDQKLVEIDVQWPTDHQVECPDCQRSCAIKDHREERRWRHLDTMQFQTIIKSRVPRAECIVHRRTTLHFQFENSIIDWVHEHKEVSNGFRGIKKEDQ